MKKLLLGILMMWSFNAFSCSDHREAVCLAKAIYWESKGEHIIGKLAVASVVTYRYNSPDFPNTICGVVYQINKVSKKPEFSPHIIKGSKPRELKQWEHANQLAHDILSGKFKYQLAFKARFFHSTKIDPKWKNVTLVATIGGHKFYY